MKRPGLVAEGCMISFVLIPLLPEPNYTFLVGVFPKKASDISSHGYGGKSDAKVVPSQQPFRYTYINYTFSSGR